MIGFKQQRGYTLFLTVLMIVVFSIIAITLITTSLSGASKSEIREDITQAGELAEKGLKHLLQTINYELQTEIDKHPDGVTEAMFINTLKQIIPNYECDETNKVFTQVDTGKYRACVEEHIDKEKDTLPHQVKFKSTGISEGKEKELTSIIEFNGNQLADDMEYAVNAFISKDCAENIDNCLPGEGNVFLHGAVAIGGDINVERNLVTSNRSYERYARDYWIHTYFPSALKDYKNNVPSIQVGGNVYTVTWTSNTMDIGKFDYNTHISRIDDFPDTPPYKKVNKIDENVFNGNFKPRINERTDFPGKVDLEITEKIDEERATYKYSVNDSGVRKVETRIIGGDVEGIRRVLRNANFPNDKVVPLIDGKYKGDFIINGKSTFKQFSAPKNLHLGQIRNDNKIEFKEGLYVAGDLVFYNNTEVKGPIYVEGNVILDGHNVKIDGPMYVNGDVEIKNNRKLTINSVIYTKKSFKMQHTKMINDDSDPDPDEMQGDYIVYADGPIVIKRVNRFSNKPDKINTYLYSNNSIEIDGNETNLHIYGGISAPRIVLNSIRGKSSMLPHRIDSSGRQATWGSALRYFDGTKAQLNAPSRLQIHYDNYIIEKYSNLLLESRITEALPPKIIDIK